MKLSIPQNEIDEACNKRDHALYNEEIYKDGFTDCLSRLSPVLEKILYRLERTLKDDYHGSMAKQNIEASISEIKQLTKPE